MTNNDIFQRSIATLDLSPEVRSRLQDNGYFDVSKLQSKTPNDLVKGTVSFARDALA
jgi:hypothetical protein